MNDIDLVIKIPEEVHKASQIIDVKYEDTVQIPLEAIANGTPLSEELDALQGDIQDEVLKWHRTLYLSGRVDAADAVAFALQLVNEQFAGIKKAKK